MKVVFVSDHFSAPSEPGILRTWELSRHLGESGHQVVVVAPRTHYLFNRDSHSLGATLSPGVQVTWMPTSDFSRGRLGSRLRYYAEQLALSTWEVWRSRSSDVVVAGLTPSVLAIGPYLVSRARHIPFVLDERDLALDAAEQLGTVPKPVIRLARGVEQYLLRHADAIAAVTPGLQNELIGKGVAEEKISLVPNGYDPPRHGGIAARDDVRERFAWGDRTVLLYAGGLGQAYDLTVVLNALQRLPTERFLLAVMGDGERRAAYRRQAVDDRLPVQFLAPVAKQDVQAICAAADIGVLPLSDVPRSRYVLSNKLFDYLGAGRPVVVTGPGDSADLVEEAGAGLVFPAGNPDALASAVLELAEDPSRAERMGAAGRRFVLDHWCRDRFAPVFRRELESLVDRRNHERNHGVGQAARLTRRERELERIRSVYRFYDSDFVSRGKRDLANPGNLAIANARWEAIREVLLPLRGREGLRILDVGCGSGEDVRRIGDLFAPWHPTLVGVDILPERIERATRALPSAQFLMQSADHLPFPTGSFDVIVASTLFSSILDDSLAAAIAGEMLRLLASGGLVVSYDIRYPNPLNRHTRPVRDEDLRRLFPDARIHVRRLTLLPQVARALGSLTPRLYEPLHRYQMLRSHSLATIRHGQTSLQGRSQRSTRQRVLVVVPAESRFPNMAVNQRLRALTKRADVEVLSAYPDSFPPDVRRRVKAVRGFPLSRRLPRSGVRLPFFALEVFLWSLTARLRRRRFALIYTFHDTSAVAGWLLRRKGTGWVIDVLDDPAQELSTAMQRDQRVKTAILRARDGVFRRIVPRADLVCTIGARIDDPLPALLAQEYGVSSTRILPLNQSVEVRLVSSQAPDRAPPSPRVVFVGFVSPVRGVDTLVHAAELLWSNGLDFDLVLVGHLRKADRAWLEASILRARGRIRYLGVLPSEQTIQEMSQATVGVLPFPERRETAPVQAVTGIEYLSLGKPLVATDLVGARALVSHGENGYLVPPDDARAMAEAISRLIEDRSMATSMGAASRERAMAFDVSVVNQQLEEALRRWL